MGWFLTRPKKKPARASAGTSTATGGETWDRTRTLQGLVWLASIITVIGLVFGWRLAEREISAAIGERGALVSIDQVTLADAPDWLSLSIQRDLCWLVAGQVSADPLDAQAMQQASAALAANPWVQSVQRVERTRQGVTITATYRRPVAVVQQPVGSRDNGPLLRRDDRFRLVDANGVVLPSDGLGLRDEAYRGVHLKALSLPVIVGVAQASPGPGQVWQGKDLEAGLKLVQLLKDEDYARQIVAYDVSGRDTRGRIMLVLRTRHGAVRWGLPPGDEQAVESDALMKMRGLAATQKRYDSIDAGGRTVDVFGPLPIVRQADFQRTNLADRTQATDRTDHVRRTRYDR